MLIDDDTVDELVSDSDSDTDIWEDKMSPHISDGDKEETDTDNTQSTNYRPSWPGAPVGGPVPVG